MKKDMSKLKRLVAIILCVFLSFSVVSSVALNTFADGDDDSSFDDAFGEDDDDPEAEGSGETGDPSDGSGSETITIDDDTPFPSEQCTSGFGGTSWALCPGIETIAEGANGLYGLLAKRLNLSPSIVSTDVRTSATYLLWDYIRGVANILVIILMVIVILSQITGYGINNYGIKRMLPRIIIAAILVNLSYYLCQIAVDISNIIGTSLGSTLNGVAHTVANNVGVTYTGENIVRIFVIILVAALGGGTVIFQGIKLGAGSSMALSIGIGILFLVLIIGLAVLIFFLMLALRQILAMVCVALSPLAIACMILPNTENIYKSWFKLLRSILIVYPICGLLYGLSCVIEVLALAPSNGSYDFLELIIASIACFLPFYAAPVLMIRALKGIGNIGTMVSNVGRRGRNGLLSLHRATQNSERMRAFKDRGVDSRRVRSYERNLKRANSGRNSLTRWWGERRTTSPVDAERYVAAQQRILKREIENATNQSWIANRDTMKQAERNKAEIERDRIQKMAEVQASDTTVQSGRNQNTIAAREARLKNEDWSREGAVARMEALQDERQRRIRDEETRASLRDGTSNFDIAQTTASLRRIAQNTESHPNTDVNTASQIRVLSQALAATGPGKGQLADVVTDERITPEVRNFIAGEAQNDPSLSGTIKSKNAFASRYLSDINAAANVRPDDANYAVAQATLGLSYNQWLNQATTHADANPGETNLQYVVRRDLSDDADLAKLSSAALQSAVSQMSTDRLQTIVNARNYHSLFSDADRRAIIEGVLAAKRSPDSEGQAANFDSTFGNTDIG